MDFTIPSVTSTELAAALIHIATTMWKGKC